MPLERKITAITEGVDFDRPSNTFVRTRVVQYMVGTHGPFQLTLRAEDFTTERVKQLIEAAAQHIDALFPS